MQKGAEAFRSIGEVAKLIGVAPHVLRYWETQFTQLKPMKRPDGRRYYRPEDVRLAAGLCEILRDEGLTIRGARKLLARDRGEAVRARGAARIDEVIGAGPAEIAPADGIGAQDRPAPSPLPRGRVTTRPEERPTAAHALNGAGIGDDPLAEEDPQDMAPHSPRSRHRPRRRHGATDGGLPLFPDLDRMGRDTAWLARLGLLAARLRALAPGDARVVAASPRMDALRDAISRIY
ncbi:MerR family transcriptional regulator [Paracoccus spongiarum]|uniref:MerR family transcriptional regulator n=1 Tax=Paracoccus spongiarum TaxID=3064387 RepID=A0ABT9JAB8_9RHOB|nr:MerR family transcriptional regulator [Paracoccus sp. 2205BS29-5]MDP5306749.1 MerR family transcriptional regulator [Paracoccus sp. 2205BS29-5]